MTKGSLASERNVANLWRQILLNEIECCLQRTGSKCVPQMVKYLVLTKSQQLVNLGSVCYYLFIFKPLGDTKETSMQQMLTIVSLKHYRLLSVIIPTRVRNALGGTVRCLTAHQHQKCHTVPKQV